jgi:hypothetical protein
MQGAGEWQHLLWRDASVAVLREGDSVTRVTASLRHQSVTLHPLCCIPWSRQQGASITGAREHKSPRPTQHVPSSQLLLLCLSSSHLQPSKPWQTWSISGRPSGRGWGGRRMGSRRKQRRAAGRRTTLAHPQQHSSRPRPLQLQHPTTTSMQSRRPFSTSCMCGGTAGRCVRGVRRRVGGRRVGIALRRAEVSLCPLTRNGHTVALTGPDQAQQAAAAAPGQPRRP